MDVHQLVAIVRDNSPNTNYIFSINGDLKIYRPRSYTKHHTIRTSGNFQPDFLLKIYDSSYLQAASFFDHAKIIVDTQLPWMMHKYLTFEVGEYYNVNRGNNLLVCSENNLYF